MLVSSDQSFLAVIMFWFILVAKVLIIGCILNASIQYAIEARFETKDGDVVAKYKSSKVAFTKRGVIQASFPS